MRRYPSVRWLKLRSSIRREPARGKPRGRQQAFAHTPELARIHAERVAREVLDQRIEWRVFRDSVDTSTLSLRRLSGQMGLSQRTYVRLSATALAPNLLARDFTAAAPHQTWSSDITCIATVMAGCTWRLFGTVDRQVLLAGMLDLVPAVERLQRS